MSIRSNDRIKLLYFVLSLSCGSNRDLPAMAVIATCRSYVHNLMIEPDHRNDIASVILQVP